ncbi:DUF6430 domain-containing protein [Enterobacteriaceae bacterium H18W14]|uniref:macro domain-containing protein n=1 Tax=Dryocola boscaweniae TaxID=2925397 RepID=UPI0022EFEC2E|nr:macro domain-containing protein [Dryocola boscaweniae]MCT4715620.1 DUF6430 domain-containing protein [Dryocola boscaweniae]
MGLTKDLASWRFIKSFLLKTFACVGAISTILQFIALFFPKSLAVQGSGGLSLAIGISLIIGVITSWPRPIEQQYSSPNTKIRIIKGDILDATGHLVIGTCDTFDTKTPTIIARSSLQGQVLEKLYGGDLEHLDRQLHESLADKLPVGEIKKDGKKLKFGIGAIATIKQSARNIFFVAYTEMNEHNQAYSTADNVWKSLTELWSTISRKGNGYPVYIPVIGGGQARLSSVLPAQDSIRFTILSFMFASRKEKICDELVIVVHPNDYKRLDRLELQSFLSSLKPS